MPRDGVVIPRLFESKKNITDTAPHVRRFPEGRSPISALISSPSSVYHRRPPRTAAPRRPSRREPPTRQRHHQMLRTPSIAASAAVSPGLRTRHASGDPHDSTRPRPPFVKAARRSPVAVRCRRLRGCAIA